MPLERTASVEDMVGNLWRLGRTPSQAEFEQFFSNIAQVGSQQNLAAAAQAAATANQGAEPSAEQATGIPRVASIDLLRKMMMNHQPGMVPGAPVAPSPTMMPGMFPGAAGMQGTAAAFGFGPTAGFAPGMVPGVLPGGMETNGGVSPAPVTKTTPKKPAAKRKAPAAKEPKEPSASAKKKAAAKRSVTPEGGTDGDDFSDDGEDDGKGGKTTDEVRRQRRMLSNRESARRSRRRKLEHVAVLDNAINGHKAENVILVERLREMEQRAESVIRENAGLKSEVERLTAALRDAVANGGKPSVSGDLTRSTSLQRIASTGALGTTGPKATLGDGTASPAIGEDSPRGFVPFRSLQSYENLLSLQAQTGGR